MPKLGSARQRIEVPRDSETVKPVLSMIDVSVEYPKNGRTPAFKAVEGVSLEMGSGAPVAGCKRFVLRS